MSNPGERGVVGQLKCQSGGHVEKDSGPPVTGLKVGSKNTKTE